MSSNTNFATFNQLSNQEGNGAIGSAYSDLDKSNTEFYVSDGSSGMCINIATPSSGGKWYCEFYLSGSVGNYAWVGYYPVKETPEVKEQWAPSSNTTWTDTGIVSVHSMGRYFYTEGQYTDSGATSFTTGDVISIALDLDNGATYFAKNGTYMNSGNPASGSSKTGAAPVEGAYSKEYFLAVGSAGSSGHTWTINAGQDSTFNGAISAGGNTDANGFGDFKYTVPSGYLSLCSANVPVSDAIDPAGDNGTDENPTKQFNPVTYTGNGSDGHGITGVGFQPDLVWLKKRSASASNQLYDSSRGTGKLLSSDSTAAEATYSTVLQSFDSDGFTLGTSAAINGSSATMVGWCWRANGGTTASNSDGSITSTVQANTAGGFSIILYTGTGSNATIGHGLSAAPDFMLFKRRSGPAQNWKVYHTSIGATKVLTLNDDRAPETDSTMFQNTEPTNSVASIGTQSNVNTSGLDYVCYAWHNVEGFQRFGSYAGNGNADGTFVYTGFRPRMLFTKRTTGVGGWRTRDTARDTYNPSDTILWWDLSQQEYSNSNYRIDILSNGFKLRTSSSDFNSTGTWLYGAWGDVPFKYNNTF